MSCSPGKAVLDIVCGSISASLCVKDLYNGSNRCVLLGSVVLTPCDFERRAVRGSTKNWKKSIRYCGRPLGEFLESYTSSEGRKCFKFVSSPFNYSTTKTSGDAYLSRDTDLSASSNDASSVIQLSVALASLSASSCLVDTLDTGKVLAPVVACTESAASVSNVSINTSPVPVNKSLISAPLSLVSKSSIVISPPTVSKSSVSTSPSTVNKSSVNTSPSTVSKSSVNTSPSTVSKSSVNTSPSSVNESSVDNLVSKSSVNISSSPVTTAVAADDPDLLLSSLEASPGHTSSPDSDLNDYPLCNKHFSSCSHLWQHINFVHISRSTFPPADFFDSCNRLIYSQPSCHWASHLRFRNSGCSRLLSTGKHCGAPLVNANTVSSIPLSQLSIPCASIPPIIDEPSSTLSDPLQIGLTLLHVALFKVLRLWNLRYLPL